DWDFDFDVDASDLAAFVACTSGPLIAQADPACTPFDADGDGDVDHRDFGVFQGCMSGRNKPADVGCGPPR
ncbi:MAG: hypothetical protein HRF43_19895, partial [Phycisphaerae bacterium]